VSVFSRFLEEHYARERHELAPGLLRQIASDKKVSSDTAQVRVPLVVVNAIPVEDERTLSTLPSSRMMMV
jgi:hypothetical protein